MRPCLQMVRWKKRLVAMAAMLCAGLAAAEVPLLSEMEKKKSEQAAEGGDAEKLRHPRELSVEEINFDVTAFLPAGALFYLEAANGAQLVDALAGTSLRDLLKDSRTRDFLKDTPLSFANLFRDLPPAYSRPEVVSLWQGMWQISSAFAAAPGKVLLAAYPGGRHGLQVIFLAQGGRERKAEFDEIQRLVEIFLQECPDFIADESPHEDDYVDVLRSSDRKVELAVGFLRHFVLVANSGSLARHILAAAKAESHPKPLQGSTMYRELEKTVDSKAHVRGFFDLRGMARQTEECGLLEAAAWLNLAGDVAGRGKEDGCVYYDLFLDGKRFIEHIYSPTASEEAELPGRLQMVCRPAAGEAREWATARLVPNQPAPLCYLAIQAHPEQLANFLKSSMPFGRSLYAGELAAAIPPALVVKDPSQQKEGKRGALDELAGQENALLAGEAALALFASVENVTPWLIILTLRQPAQAEELLASRDPVKNLGGLKLYSFEKEKWESSPCWAIFSENIFHKLSTSYLVIASSGAWLQALVDQVTVLTLPLAENKDFQNQSAAFDKDSNIICYYNLPEEMAALRRHLPQVIREHFKGIPSISTVRPPFVDYLSGAMAAATVRAGEPLCRWTLASPLAMMPSMAGLLAIKMPVWIRERERMQETRSRRNLGEIWLTLQNYATLHGRFPDSLADLQALFPEARRASLFVCEGALAEVESVADAAKISYQYVPRLQPTDEQDMPILYEGGAWHWDYEGMYPPPGSNRKRKEDGEYRRWRLVLRLDGTIQAYSEDDFMRQVMPRLQKQDR